MLNPLIPILTPLAMARGRSMAKRTADRQRVEDLLASKYTTLHTHTHSTCKILLQAGNEKYLRRIPRTKFGAQLLFPSTVSRQHGIFIISASGFR